MRWTSTIIIPMLLLPLAPMDADAQYVRGQRPVFTIEAFGGGASFGTFLEQARLEGSTAPDGLFTISSRAERELTAETSFAFGGSLGIWPLEKTGARLGFTWTSSDFEFEDDTGTGETTFDTDDVAGMDLFVTSLEVLRFLLDREERRIAPYANAGFVGAWWSLDNDDEDTGDIVADDDTEFRFGGIGGLGVHIRLSNALGARLEVSTLGIRSPFDGDDAFRVVNPQWFTFDESDGVSVTRFTAALTYTFMKRRR